MTVSTSLDRSLNVFELRVPALTFAVPYALIRGKTMSREGYQEAGRRIANAIVLRANNPAAKTR